MTDQMVESDKHCTVWTPWMINHSAFAIDDMSQLVKRLKEDDQPFFGPVRREDGVYQIYVRIPYAFYFEIDSGKYDVKVGGKETTTWVAETNKFRQSKH
eukprot:CAMPEP_0184018554 /NCGR_PEP_ID=MMETSP0954-20121128/8215_1 /TAXON_ID=627963 /ORGANISM="Aplanochytrium sp, Strain PBS07" /LENGTH=98 /DNA_ID=CAMNT_0026300031 /DNA_START=651 /DNA_END=947 /DNA_ORIENTATION=-